nr:MAG: ORF1 [Torque teno midi virus]
MPFWWYRRRKPWFGRRRRQTYRTKKFRRRRRTRRPRRRWYRRTYRRRRRSYRKVRRKKKRLILTQWQPESVRKCKIKGTGTIVLGAQGSQFKCYTTYKSEWTNPRNPAGGGFGCELITLNYLYKEYTFHQNIWTTSNEWYDLCRYTGGRVTFYRHPETDFILVIDTQPPFDLHKFTYMYCHPFLLMQRKRKRFLLSTATAPNGKLKKTIKFKPPKQLVNKWMFQEDFGKFGLVTLVASACNLRYPNLTPKNENLLITLYYMQVDFYKDSTWANNTGSTPYKPYSTCPTTMTYISEDNKGSDIKYTMNDIDSYEKSVNIEKGFFCPKVLKAKQVQISSTQQYAMTPCGVVRYNPLTDNGKGNKMWLSPNNSGSYKIPRDEDLIMEDYPLWLMLYGWTSFIKDKKHDWSYFSAYILVIKTDKVYRVSGVSTEQYYVFLSKNFINGLGPNGTKPSLIAGKYWYPTLSSQFEVISDIVNTGPFIPKYSDITNSTWECTYSYDFYFKWGGSQPPQPDAEDPSKKGKYEVPDKQFQRLQITNPDSQNIQTVLRTWDYRRGLLTKKALKRMYDNLETDESISTDSDNCSSPKKKKKAHPTLHNPTKENKKIQSCLQSLCEESIFQEPPENTNLIQLIQQQHQQQQLLKHNLLTLVTDLKHKQRTLLHQTGMLF